jgi:hypothetical protein
MYVVIKIKDPTADGIAGLSMGWWIFGVCYNVRKEGAIRCRYLSAPLIYPTGHLQTCSVEE